jgi:hypothetical protein
MFITKTWPTCVSLAGDAGSRTIPVASNAPWIAGSVSTSTTRCGDAESVTAA